MVASKRLYYVILSMLTAQKIYSQFQSVSLQRPAPVILKSQPNAMSIMLHQLMLS